MPSLSAMIDLTRRPRQETPRSKRHFRSATLQAAWGVQPVTIGWVLDHLSRQQEFRSWSSQGETALTVDPVNPL